MTDNTRRRPPLVATRPKAAKKTQETRGKGGPRAGTGAKTSSGGNGKGTRRRGQGGGSRRPPRGPLGHLWAALVAVMRGFWALAWRGAVMIAFVIFLTAVYDYSTMPPAKTLLDGRVRGSVTMLDDTGKPFAWRGQTFGGTVTATSISPYLKDAIVATEDRRFYSNFGVSPRGIIGAMIINIRAGRGPFEGNGGSTITQQVAKLLCMGRPYDPKVWKTEAAYQADCRVSSLWRKIREVPYALAMDAKYPKNQILTIYINRVYLGAGTRGFEAAAERYFGKHASQVTPAEAAMLAGLLRAPSYYAPTNNLARAQDRANVIIGLMEQQKYITPQQADYARSHPAQLADPAKTKAGGYFADWVMESAPSFLTRDTTEDVVMQTTLDPRIQAAAEAAVQKVFDQPGLKKSKIQVAAVVMSPDGAVRAMIGGRKMQAAGAFNRATQALRQTGSSFKPFVYGAALDMGYSPNDLVDDAPLTINIPGSGPWKPLDYERTFKGVVTLTTALKDSLNIPAVKVSEAVGRDMVAKVAHGFGVKSPLAKGPAIALGASEATLLDMTGAYAGILNGGVSVAPYAIRSVSLRGESTPLVDRAATPGQRVISAQADGELVYMMNQVVNGGTATRAKLPDREAAGKTGTTQNWRDAWFIGFTSDYIMGVWVGHDDNSPMKRITGGSLPAEIWHDTMATVDKELNLPPKPLPMITPLPAQKAAPAAAPAPKVPGNTVISRILNNILGGLAGRN